jgi:glucose-6-phosphate isomerase
MEGLYEDEVRFSQAVEQGGDAIIYKVSDVRSDAVHGDLIFGTTFMEPGRIGNEFFMTRGHIHAKANRPETYYGESGEGLMLLESPEGTTRVLEVLPQQMIYVPPFWIHRSVNIGSVPLVLSFCYPSDSGQDYSIIERSGGMASRIVADGSGWKEVRNSSYRPREPSEIARVYETGDHEQ